MSLLSDIKFFLKKYVKNPAVVAGLAYVIYRFITENAKKEPMAESIQPLEKNEAYDFFYDDSLKKFILVDRRTLEVYSADKEESMKALINQKFKNPQER